MNVKFTKFSHTYLSFEFVYFNDDFSVSVLVGCNSGNYIGSSDVFVLSRNELLTLDEIDKAMGEAEKLKFDLSDISIKNTESCIGLK